MTTIYAAPKLVYVAADGEGGHVLKIQPPAGELLVLPLDLKTATRLTEDFAKVARSLAQHE
jgi:hypothetical protein